MSDAIDVLAGLGIKVSTLISGFAGGLVYYYLEGSKKVEKSTVGKAVDTFVSGFVGSVMAVYVAPLGLLYFKVPGSAIEIQTGAGFVVGITGIYLGHGIIRLAANWARDPKLPRMKD